MGDKSGLRSSTMGVYLPDGRTKEGVFDNILIEKNTFIDALAFMPFPPNAKSIPVAAAAIKIFFFVKKLYGRRGGV